MLFAMLIEFIPYYFHCSVRDAEKAWEDTDDYLRFAPTKKSEPSMPLAVCVA